MTYLFMYVADRPENDISTLSLSYRNFKFVLQRTAHVL